MSVPVSEFKYAVPRTFSFTKYGCSFELLVKTQGYTAADSVKLASLSFPAEGDGTPGQSSAKRAWGTGTVRRQAAERVQICNYCHKPGHVWKDCTTRIAKMKEVQCYNCMEYGHYSKQCKNEPVCRICRETGGVRS